MSARLHLGGKLEASASSMSAFCNFKAKAQDTKIVRDTVSPDLDLANLADEYAGIQLHDIRHRFLWELENYCSIFARLCVQANEMIMNLKKVPANLLTVPLFSTATAV
jgi:hypothetical protein